MHNETRAQYEAYVQRIAELNNVNAKAVESRFTATPSVQQTLETKIQESSQFLNSINIIGVDEQEGEKIGLGVSGPIASTQKTDGGSSGDRTTRDIAVLDDNNYRCEQTNYDTHIRYATLDAWAKFQDFQTRLTGSIIQRIALDRIMIGFNGTSRADTSNISTNKLLQDVNIGWLQQIRTNAPERWMKEVADSSNKIVIRPKYAAGETLAEQNPGDYQNLDALVYDLVNNLIDPWYQESTDLVVLCGRQLLADKYFPLVNDNSKPTESIAADLIISQKRIGGLPAIRVPYFPANTLLVTQLKNLSVYYQRGAQRRSVMDNPKRDRIETYQSSNDAFVIEDYGCVALAENIEIQDPVKGEE